jgi:RNA polymerase sigma-70 factor (ECF subfamily)
MTPSFGISLDELVIQNEARDHLHESMKYLTIAQHEVVLLRFLQGYSIAEVAVLVGRSEGAVKVLQHRALHTLAKHLQRG